MTWFLVIAGVFLYLTLLNQMQQIAVTLKEISRALREIGMINEHMYQAHIEEGETTRDA